MTRTARSEVRPAIPIRPIGIATDGTDVYWVVLEFGVESVRAAPIGGGSVRTLAETTYDLACAHGPAPGTTLEGAPWMRGEITVFGGDVDWLGADHSTAPGAGAGGSCAGDRVVDLRKVPTAGGESTLIARVAPRARQLLVDEAFVTWIQGPLLDNLSQEIVSCSVRRAPTP